MNRRAVLSGLGAAAVGLAVFAGVRAGAQDRRPADQAAPSLQKLLEDQLAVLKEMDRVKRAAGTLGPGPSYDIESEYLWSRRLLEVEKALGKKEDDRLTSLQGHLDRMKRLEERVQQLVKTRDAPEVDVLAARFYRLEAEYWLAQAKTR